MLKFITRVFSACFFSMLLTACGGDGGSKSNNPSSATAVSFISSSVSVSDSTISSSLSSVPNISSASTSSISLSSQFSTISSSSNSFSSSFSSSLSSSSLISYPLVSLDIPIIPSGAKVTGGFGHTLLISPLGEVKGYGANLGGQISIPSAASSNVVAVAGGNGHSLALKNNGEIVQWGNIQGDIPSEIQGAVVAIDTGALHSLALSSQGRVYAWGTSFWGGNNNPTAVPEEALSNIVAISAGWDNCLALTQSGRIIAWGDGESSVVPEEIQGKVIAISAGANINAALLSNNTLVTWKKSSIFYAQAENVIAISAGGFDVLGLKNDGTLFIFDNYSVSQTNIPTNLQGEIKYFGAGHNFSLVIKQDDSVVGWGSNSSGQLNIE